MASGFTNRDKVVISGMSGAYPNANNVKELSHILYNKQNPVTTDNPRWKVDYPEALNATGKVGGLDLFDAQFFKVYHRLSNAMDVASRKIFEHTYQALFDAGVNPIHLSGKRIGVYVACNFSEMSTVTLYTDTVIKNGLAIMTGSMSMFANRISYWLNCKGPSILVDAASCGSLVALQQAYEAIVRGECEAAIVGGMNSCYHAETTINYARTIKLSKDGKTRAYDTHAAGCGFSDAVNVLFLQKECDAHRIYAEVVHVKCEFISIEKGRSDTTDLRKGFQCDVRCFTDFLRRFYQETNVSPEHVDYVEGFGSATPEVDKAELEVLDEVFCVKRRNPLLVGSVTSNIGFTDAAAGISSITKVLLGYHTRKIAANLHLTAPRQDIDAVSQGRIKIVSDHEPFDASYAAINGLSFTGVNAHVVLEGRYKAKDVNRYKSLIPYLITVSGRQESGVHKIVDNLIARPIDPEEIALLHNIYESKINGHLGRGFAILDTNVNNETKLIRSEAEYFNDISRPLWFVYSGMGSQWSGMGAALMNIPIFAAAIERCHRVLESKGMDIVHIITTHDLTIFDDILNCFVGIAAVQIGLTDVLRELGLVPDGIIGHSVGELGCAYADGCFTTEEMILSAYSRGFVSKQVDFIHGSMAAVGIGYKKLSNMCPPEIEIACRNSHESCTISGPAEAVQKFIGTLKQQNIFAKEVQCSNIAYHSRYIAEAGPLLLDHLKEVIKTPKLRSDRWVSTSIPKERWGEPEAKYSSAEYHTNNLLNPVLFEETSRLIPPNAVLVEVAPYGLLQAILKRSLPTSCTNIPLTRRRQFDNVVFLEAIGKLYMEGYNLKVKNLYPKVEFPVSTGTPMLSHLVEWIHSEKWALPILLSTSTVQKVAACKFKISIHDDEYQYLRGHVIRGATMFPSSAVLVAVWDTLCMTLGVAKQSVSVSFRDLRLFCQPLLHEQRQLRLNVSLHRGSGKFEVIDDATKVASGFITTDNFSKSCKLNDISENLDLSSDDVYNLFLNRGYEYRANFRSIHKANSSLSLAKIHKYNWVTLIDGMIQLNMLKRRHNYISQAVYIRKMVIHINNDIISNEPSVSELSDGVPVETAEISELNDSTICGGVVMNFLRFHDQLPSKENNLKLWSLKFIPYFQDYSIDETTTMQIFLQIVAENDCRDEVNIIDLRSNSQSTQLDKDETIFRNIPGLMVHHQVVLEESILTEKCDVFSDANLILLNDLSLDDNVCQKLYRVLRENTFVVYKETNSSGVFQVLASPLYKVVSAYIVGATKWHLLRWRPNTIQAITTTVNIKTKSDISSLSSIFTNITPNWRVLIFSTYPLLPTLKEILQKWRRKLDFKQIYLISANENTDFQVDLPEIILNCYIWNEDAWGGEFYVPLREDYTRQHNVRLHKVLSGPDPIEWLRLPESSSNDLDVTVHYAGLNSLDVKRYNGNYPINSEDALENTFGMDFSGMTKSGLRVMGLIEGGAVSSQVRARSDLLWPVPAHWSLEDAATVPFPYCMAFYCLFIKSQLRSGMTLLVHGASGGLGQAAVAIGLSYGAQVFATVGDIVKKKFLCKLFPELKYEHIGNSRDSTFEHMIMQATEGKGCDIILCTLKGNLKDISIKCCAALGIVVDTCVVREIEDYSYGMFNMFKSRSYSAVDFMSLFEYNNTATFKRLQRLVCEGVSRGWVRPLSRVTYAPLAAPRALRLLAAAAQRGRVLLRTQLDTHLPMTRIHCSTDQSHLVVCDEPAYGLLVAQRLIIRGVKKLHIHCTRPSSIIATILRSSKYALQVNESFENLSNDNNVLNLFNLCKKLGPMEGIHVILTNSSNAQSIDELTTIVNNLDVTSRRVCLSLRYFTILNADSDIGKNNCIYRRLLKLPATFITAPELMVNIDNASSYYKVSRLEVIEAFERAAASDHSVILASLQDAKKLTLLQQISIICDLSIPENTEPSTTLLQLGVDLARAQILSTHFHEKYQVRYSVKDVQEMSFKKVTELEEMVSESKFTGRKGLESFISYVDSDELSACVDIVFLSTLVTNTSKLGIEYDVNELHLIIVPGIEGHHARFISLCERLKLSAVVLQPSVDKPWETIQELAHRYVKVILQKFVLTDKFYILGYEVGVFVALEMASIFEQRGISGTIFCLGGCPKSVQAEIRSQLCGLNTTEELQHAVAAHIIQLMLGEKDHSIVQSTVGNVRETLDVYLRNFLGRVSHSAQYVRSIIEATSARLILARDCTVKLNQLRSLIVVLQSATCEDLSHGICAGCEELQRYSRERMFVHHLNSPLTHAAHDLRCAALVNHHLDEDVLNAFQLKNICDNYIASDEFTTCTN